MNATASATVADLLDESNAETETEALSDEAIRDAIAAEFASRPEPKKRTLSDLYTDGVMLVCGAMGYPRARLKTEANAIRLYELTLMWALNNRDQTAPNILPEEIGGTSEPDLPAAHETIAESTSPTPEAE